MYRMTVVCGKCGRSAHATMIGVMVVEMVGLTEQTVRPYKLWNADELSCPCGETVVWAGFPDKALHFDVDKVKPWDELYDYVANTMLFRKVRVWVERDGTMPSRQSEQTVKLMDMVVEHRRKVIDEQG